MRCKLRLCPGPVFCAVAPVIDGKPGRRNGRRKRSFPVFLPRLTAKPSAPGCRRSPVFRLLFTGNRRLGVGQVASALVSSHEEGRAEHGQECARRYDYMRSRQDLFLRSRISANTFHAGLPASPTDFATSGTSARRNGFAAFSAPMVDGMVGSRAARSLSTSVARARSAALSGSTVLAKATLALVYSWPQ